MARTAGIALTILAFVLALPFDAPAAMKHYDNRDEGTADEQHGDPDFELLGFYDFRQNYPLQDGVTLRLRFYLPGSGQFSVKAREIKADIGYLMRPNAAKIVDKNVDKKRDGWRELEGWPVRVAAS